MKLPDRIGISVCAMLYICRCIKYALNNIYTGKRVSLPKVQLQFLHMLFILDLKYRVTTCLCEIPVPSQLLQKSV